METLSVNELKSLCQQRKLPVSGTKAELIERLVRGSQASASSASSATAARATTTATPATSATASTESALFPSDYDALTLPQLKELCRERQLPVGGIKDDLITRLKASDPHNMTLQQLKDRCRDAALPVTGTKADLVDRVIKSMSAMTQLQNKSVDELKDLCRERGVPVTGKKDDLIERLKQARPASSSTASTTAKTSSKAADKSAPTTSEAPKKNKTKASVPSYEAMTIPQLKELCRDNKLMVGGTKDELVERLNKAASAPPSRPSSASKSSSSSTLIATAPAAASKAESGYDAMMVPQLKDLCRSRTVPVMGTKEELIKRLREHDDVVRAMFKKRKSPSSENVSATPAPAKSGKRAAETDEPKTKKIKTTATKTSGSSVTKPPVAKNVGAFARKSAPAKPKKKASAQPPKANGRYLVYSTCAHPRDGFHSYDGPGEPKYHGSFATKEEANDRVNTLFYRNNPWGLGAEEMDANLDVVETWPGNLLRLEVCPPDSEQWVVGAKDIGAAADDDGDVIMVSGSETEDEGYAY